MRKVRLRRSSTPSGAKVPRIKEKYFLMYVSSSFGMSWPASNKRSTCSCSSLDASKAACERLRTTVLIVFSNCIELLPGLRNPRSPCLKQQLCFTRPSTDGSPRRFFPGRDSTCFRQRLELLRLWSDFPQALQDPPSDLAGVSRAAGSVPFRFFAIALVLGHIFSCMQTSDKTRRKPTEPIFQGLMCFVVTIQGSFYPPLY